MPREQRPKWAFETYSRWRKRSPEAFGRDFEGCGWFQDRSAWCRQNAARDRIEVHENGDVYLKHGMKW